MYSFHWTVKAVKQVGKLPAGAWVEISANTTSSSFWTQSQYRKAIAERFVSKYGLKCPVSKFEQQVNNVNFDYTLISK